MKPLTTILKKLFPVFLTFALVLQGHCATQNQNLAPQSLFIQAYNNFISNNFFSLFQPSTLVTEGTENIFNFITSQVKNGARYLSLDGFTGTGKTFFTDQLAKHLLAEGFDPVIVHGDGVAPYYKKGYLIKRAFTLLKMLASHPLGTDASTRDLYQGELLKLGIELSKIKKNLLKNPEAKISYNRELITLKGEEFIMTKPVLHKNSVILFEGQYLSKELSRTPLIDCSIGFLPDVEQSISNRKEKRKDLRLNETYVMKKFLAPQYLRYYRESLNRFNYFIDNRDYNNPRIHTVSPPRTFSLPTLQAA